MAVLLEDPHEIHLRLMCFILVKLEFGVLVFVEGGKPKNPEKNPRSKARKITNSTHIQCMASGGNQTRATLVGGEPSHPYSPRGALLMKKSLTKEKLIFLDLALIRSHKLG